MKLTTYNDANAFMAGVQSWLEIHEAVNSLVLGLAARLQADPNFYPSQPLFRSVEDENGLVLAALMTPPHNLILASERNDTLPAVQALVQHLSAEGWDLPGVLGPSELARQFSSTWSELHEIKIHTNMAERLFVLTEVIHPPQPPGRMRTANEADKDLLIKWIYDFNLQAVRFDNLQEAVRIFERRVVESSIYLWDDEGPVSMAAWTRPVGYGISISLVYTPPEYRRRGYASACVAGLSQNLLDAGYQYCALFTDLANPTSNHIYQQIGYQPVCDFDEFAFEPPSPSTPNP